MVRSMEDQMAKTKKASTKLQRTADLNRARETWIATSRADRLWRALVEVLGVKGEHRGTVISRLRTHAVEAGKTGLTPVLNSIARAVKS
jgi:hypothetical protein